MSVGEGRLAAGRGGNEAGKSVCSCRCPYLSTGDTTLAGKGARMSGNGVELKITGATFKVDLLELFSSVFKTSLKLLMPFKTGVVLLDAAPSAVGGLFGALKAFKRQETIELKAWILALGGILYALERTINELPLVQMPDEGQLKEFSNELAVRVQTRSYTIEPDFFSNPGNFRLLDDVAHELSVWLVRFGISESPHALELRLKNYFAPGLHRTWMKDQPRFAPLEEALNSPFSDALKQQQEFEGYLQYVE